MREGTALYILYVCTAYLYSIQYYSLNHYLEALSYPTRARTDGLRKTYGADGVATAKGKIGAGCPAD